MRRLIFRTLAFFFLVSVAAAPVAAQRTIEFEASEVTEAGVTVSPDGQWLIFTMLGHLFRLPVRGGTAEQLTFGPYYNSDPVFSPDGSRVAFVSDRDGSEGNVFVLELTTGQITQVTHEAWAARPAWSPDGQSIAYLSMIREVPGLSPLPRHSHPDTVTAIVKRVALNGNAPETLTAPPQLIGSLFYLRDGRLAWAAIELEPDRGTGAPRTLTRVQAMNREGTVSTLRTLPGYAAPVIPSPTRNGLYARRFFPVLPWHTQRPDELLFISLSDDSERVLFTQPRPRGWAPRFAVTADDQTLYLGQAGRIWRISLSSQVQEPIAFRAHVKLEVQESTPPRRPNFPSPGSIGPPRALLDPRLSPDGRTLVFGAAGYLWQQLLPPSPQASTPARRLFEGSAWEREPAFSPDGRHLAFVHSQHGKQEVAVFSFETGQSRTMASGTSLWNLTWDPEGQRILFMEWQEAGTQLIAVNASDGKREKLTEMAWWWGSRPHFAGESLYFTGPPGAGTLYRRDRKEKTKPEALTQLTRQFTRALVSPDEKWVAFKRNSEIWIGPLQEIPIQEEHVRRLSPEGGDSFAFTPDGSALIYAAGNRVWRGPLNGGERQEIPIRLELQRPTPPPVLLRRVRVLDFATGAFSPETSLFIEEGRIRWVGSESDHKLPPETITLDAVGRFAIPGLFDMHVHDGGILPERSLAYGITSLRDVGSWLASLSALADRSEGSSDPFPRYFFAGDIFHGGQPSSGSVGLLIHDRDDAQSHVRRWHEWGAHFLKVYFPLSWPLHRAVAEEARRQGLPVIGHGSAGVEEITKSVILGYATLEHNLTPGRAYQDVLQMLAAAGTRWCPTLSTRGDVLLVRDEPERLADPKLRAFSPPWAISETQSGSFIKFLGESEARGRWVELLASVRDAYHRGMKLLAGTDRYLGPSLRWELEYFVQAGIPPLEVLRIATQQAAEAVGAQDNLGTLEPGKLADIVLLDKNPLEDIKNTQTIWRVIKAGGVFDPEKLRPPQSADTEK